MIIDGREYPNPVFETEIRVRYAETDRMGVVYYGNYYTWYEVARGDALRKVGYPYSQLEADGIILPVTESYTKYISPVRYDDLITVVSRIEELRNVRIHFTYEIFNGPERRLCTKGFTKHAMIGPDLRLLKGDPNGSLARLRELLVKYIEGQIIKRNPDE